MKPAPQVRAPGKAFLCGEYAVLAGAPAIVTAVGRYARARVGGPSRSESPFLREAAVRAARLVGMTDAPPVIVQTDGFRWQSGDKLGLGSSAAATVAAAGLVFAAAGRDLAIAGARRELFAVADAAHRAAQSGQGSGADVAASVYGGVVRFVAGEPPRALERPRGLELVFVWTGRAAATTTLVEQVRQAGLPLGAMPELARRFADAFAAGDPPVLIEIARMYAAAMHALGEACGVPIVTREHAQFAELARRHGGAAKPSGAGGGDIGVAFLPGAAEAAALCADAHRAGLSVLDLMLDDQGVSEEPST